jgi:Ser/Thr protein kinase RdoA (MazF antagonist)
VTDIPDLLTRFWGIEASDLRPLPGGMNSATWVVEHDGTTYVVKQVVTSEVDEFATGCEVASRLADQGFVTGRPVPTTDGRLVVTEHALALLEHVPGRELRGDNDEEQQWIAMTLAGVHLAGDPTLGPSPATFATDWLSPELAGVNAHPWLAPAIEAVRAETDPLTVTWAVLHTDPSPEAFVHDDGTGTTGLIDWSGAERGPVLYDVASAVMYLGGADDATAFLGAYQKMGPLGQEEMLLLDAFRRFRWAVQGAYFAWRLSVRDLTGIADEAGNEKGLNDARESLAELGINTA